jgi:myo-inositol catabolism protein IolC
MSSHIFVEIARHVAMISAVVGGAVGATAFASVLRTWIEQRFRTRRLASALKDSEPKHRPKIIRAWSEFEGDDEP